MDKQKELIKYLRDSWSPVTLLLEKFNLTRPELSTMLAESLSVVDIRVENDIVHCS